MFETKLARSLAVLLFGIVVFSVLMVGQVVFSTTIRDLAIRRLITSGVVLKRRSDFDGGTLWHARIMGDSEAFKSASPNSIVYCSFSGMPGTPEQLDDLRVLDHLSMLDLSSTKLSGSDIVTVAFQHPRLTCLWADDTALDRRNVRQLSEHPSLLVLSATRTSVDQKTADDWSSENFQIYTDNSFRLVD